MTNSRDPFETGALIEATTKIVATVEALNIARETQIAALRIAAEVVSQKHSGAISSMTTQLIMANLFPPRK
jgi:hypothetical protein